MANITTREVGITAKGTPLSNVEVDNNFINLNEDIASRIASSEKGAALGVATLGSDGKVPATQLPSYVDDVLEYANLAAFPATGEIDKIYIALDTNRTYRWSGSAYVHITSGGAVDSVAGKTGVVTLVKGDVGLANVDNTADADKNVLSATTATNVSGGTVNAISGVINANTTDNAFRITQLGTGNALVVEDSTNPDASPVVINNSGVVIAGTTSQTTAVNSANGNAAIPLIQTNGLAAGSSALGAVGWFVTGVQSPSVIFAKSSSGVIGTHTVVTSGTYLGDVSFQGSDGTGFIRAASIRADVDGTPGTNDMPGRLVFSTTADGASSPTERMRINSFGNVGIGNGINQGDSILTVSKNLTGATDAYGVRSIGTIQTDVTSALTNFQSNPSTVASAFTLTTLRHYQATQGTFGVGSSVTNQYGFAVESNVVGATNNYGFYSSIPSATGRWNFYANGTANNYFAGNVGVGTTLPDTKLHVVDALAGGQLLVASNQTNATEKHGTFGTQHYTNAEEPALGVGVHSNATDNIVFIGGALGEFNAATQVRFYTAANNTTVSGSERMRIDSSGNVGVGTTTPSSFGKMAVVGGSAGTASSSLAINTANTAQGLRADLALYSTFVGTADNDPRRTADIVAGFNAGNWGTEYLAFSVGNNGTANDARALTSEKMRIDSSGNVGIGTNSPTSRLTITDATNSITPLTVDSGSGADATRGIALNVSGNNYGRILVPSGSGGAMAFWTGGAGVATERMRIDSSGSVGVGTTTAGGFSGTVSLGGSGNPTSGYLEGFGNAQTVPATVTTRFDAFLSAPNTVASVFTIGSFNHFFAQQGTFGAGSVVSNQAGFRASANLTGATSNYGFLAEIPAATNRWNVYASGTAQNYFAGNVGIGSGKTVPSTALDVNGTVNATALTASSATGRVALATDAGGSIQLGRLDGVASTPFIDFNSGATTVDYDVRVTASGGNGTSGNGTLTVTGTLAATAITASGIVSGLELTSSSSSGIEGGQINLAKAATSTTLTSNVVIDVYGDKLRIFEAGGTTRGVYIDLAAAAAGVATNLVGSSSGGAAVVVSDTAPVSPTSGNLWWDSTIGQLRIYYVDADTSQWVDALNVPSISGVTAGRTIAMAMIFG